MTTTHNEVFDPEVQALMTVHCLDNGKMTLVGDLMFLLARECEFEEDHEAGLELREYAGLAFGSEGAVHLVRVCGLFKPADDLELTLAAGAHHFDMMASVPAHGRIGLQ